MKAQGAHLFDRRSKAGKAIQNGSEILLFQRQKLRRSNRLRIAEGRPFQEESDLAEEIPASSDLENHLRSVPFSKRKFYLSASNQVKGGGGIPFAKDESPFADVEELKAAEDLLPFFGTKGGEKRGEGEKGVQNAVLKEVFEGDSNSGIFLNHPLEPGARDLQCFALGGGPKGGVPRCVREETEFSEDLSFAKVAYRHFAATTELPHDGDLTPTENEEGVSGLPLSTDQGSLRKRDGYDFGKKGLNLSRRKFRKEGNPHQGLGKLFPFLPRLADLGHPLAHLAKPRIDPQHDLEDGDRLEQEPLLHIGLAHFSVGLKGFFLSS